MNALIVEDEVHIARHLSRLAKRILADKAIHTHICLSIDDALDYIDKNPIDVLFLDLNLRGESGFDILKLVLSGSFHVIIVSAHTQKAIEAFEYGVLDFVPKPFSEERLKKALNRLFSKDHRNQNITKYLVIKKRNRLEIISREDILFFEAYGHYSKIHMVNGDIKSCDKSLANLESILGRDFKRIHKSYIAQVPHACSIEVLPGGKYSLVYKSGAKIPISRAIYKDIKREFTI